MNSEKIIEVKRLKKIYKKHKFLKTKYVIGIEEVSFEVYKNEIFGLLGLNGSGKTTTIKLILGLLFPDFGEIYVFGNKIPDWRINKHIGYLPELVSFNKNFTGLELLKLYASLSLGFIDNKRIKEVIDFVKLSDSIDRKISEYSKGMIQRLGLAQAIIHNPAILVFDEPTSGLDPLGIKEIRDFILQLKSQGKTIFFSSHLISELEKVCDRVAIIHKGKILKIVENKEWQRIPLEEIFISTVTKEKQ
ncbi:MAG: ABC transporter ATP-binding protein [Elusimicrobiota bacterium]|nr:ABC transporter ATP-binding protein [Endomicrobiia bacterium]MDW8164937.1 ABC transporter ATP-binding protein [Elusimicrobiota bacterium]